MNVEFPVELSGAKSSTLVRAQGFKTLLLEDATCVLTRWRCSGRGAEQPPIDCAPRPPDRRPPSMACGRPHTYLPSLLEASTRPPFGQLPASSPDKAHQGSTRPSEPGARLRDLAPGCCRRRHECWGEQFERLDTHHGRRRRRSRRRLGSRSPCRRTARRSG